MRCCKRKFMFPSNLNYCNASSLLPGSWINQEQLSVFRCEKALP